MDARHRSRACPTSARRSPKSATADFGCSRPSFETHRYDAAQDEAVIFGRAFMTREPALRGLPLPFDLTGRRIFVAGHLGMVGSSLVPRLMVARRAVLTVNHPV